MQQRRRIVTLAVAGVVATGFTSHAAIAGTPEAQKWVDSEFQPSTLSKQQQMDEMKWFIDTAAKLKSAGVKEVHVVSETLDTHMYESKTLAKAFTEITGISVKHDIIQEGDVVEKLQTSMQSGQSIYDGWISDSDLIGTHYRYGVIMPLSDYMAGEGKQYTNPGLDVKDFIGTSFTTAPDKKLYQLPDQQFANLYWFRADWFARKDLQDKFKAKYGYDLGVPVNWSAYEDIAEFFTNDVKKIDGEKVYGHMDYGKKDPSLGWRFTDAWLSMAGEADKGIPNGMPVDEWGMRVTPDGCHAVGASVTPRRRHEQSGRGVRDHQIHRLAEEVRSARSLGDDLQRSRAGAGARQDRPADLLVQRVHRIDAEARQRDQRGRHAEVADGAVAARSVLEGRHAERLSGRRLVDLLQVDAAESACRRVVIRAVRHV